MGGGEFSFEEKLSYFKTAYSGLCIIKLDDQLSGCLQGGGSLTVRRQQLEELYLAHSGSMSILMEANDHNVHHDNPEFPEGPANFTLLWYVPCRHFSLARACVFTPSSHCPSCLVEETLQWCRMNKSDLNLLGCSRRFSPRTREKVLRWLFPKAELSLLLDSAGTTVQRCLVTHSTSSQSKVSSRARSS